MPAIHPPRLKIQTSELIQTASDPEAFCRAYHDFLDYYADRTYRPSKIGEPPPLLPTYQVPKPVMRVVEKELAVWAETNRPEGLKLADALWLKPSLEFRTTAAVLIGQVYPLPIKSIFRRVETWIHSGTEERLVNVLVYFGLRRILIEYQDLYVKQMDIWLRSGNIERNRLGLKACLPLLARREFEDYPLLFKRLGKFMRLADNPLRGETLLGLRELIAQTPEEAAFFFEQSLQSTSDNQQIAWFLRKTLTDFPAITRQHLRQVLLETGK